MLQAVQAAYMTESLKSDSTGKVKLSPSPEVIMHRTAYLCCWSLQALRCFGCAWRPHTIGFLAAGRPSFSHTPAATRQTCRDLICDGQYHSQSIISYTQCCGTALWAVTGCYSRNPNGSVFACSLPSSISALDVAASTGFTTIIVRDLPGSLEKFSIFDICLSALQSYTLRSGQ